MRLLTKCFCLLMSGLILITTSTAAWAQATVWFVHADHLNTPRTMTDQGGNAIWTWDSDGFGAAAPNAQPNVRLPLRFPGQYADVETGTYYNYFRDYDPATGRYIQSDPIGLAGGSNTYNYVDANPMRNADPRGLAPNPLELACVAGPNPVCVAGVAIDAFTWVAIGGAVAGGGIIIANSSKDRASGTESSGAAVCTPENKDPCEEIRRKIRELEQKLVAKERQMGADRYDLYNRAYNSNPGGDLTGKGTWVGHMAQIEGLRLGLARAKAEAKAKGCL